MIAPPDFFLTHLNASGYAELPILESEVGHYPRDRDDRADLEQDDPRAAQASEHRSDIFSIRHLSQRLRDNKQSRKRGDQEN